MVSSFQPSNIIFPIYFIYDFRHIVFHHNKNNLTNIPISQNISHNVFSPFFIPIIIFLYNKKRPRVMRGQKIADLNMQE